MTVKLTTIFFFLPLQKHNNTQHTKTKVLKIVNRYVDQLKNNRRVKRCGLNLLYRFAPTQADELDRSMRGGGAALKSRNAYKGAEILMLELAAQDLNTNAVLFVAAIFSPLFIIFIVMYAEELGITTGMTFCVVFVIL